MGKGYALKRFFDVSLALLLLLFVAPVFIMIIVIQFFLNKGEVFFYQERPGLNGEIFTIIKFKTMSEEKDMDGRFLPDETRITKMGRVIRNCSLDEIPQLINVLIGDMSLVGPRPLLVEYLDRYDDIQQRRHEVRPGITGWAQVNGRNGIPWEKKFGMDVWYVDHCSILLDLIILFKTINRVLTGRNVAQEGHASMEPFSIKKEV